MPTGGDTRRHAREPQPPRIFVVGRSAAGPAAALATRMNKKLEAISDDQLVTATGGAVSARWLARHPYAADAFLAHHPGRAAQFTANHPWAAARIHRIAG